MNPRRRTTSRSRYVVCVNNRGYAASLEKGKIYRALKDRRGENPGYLRVVDESGEDYLFAGSRFVAVKLSRAAERALATKA